MLSASGVAAAVDLFPAQVLARPVVSLARFQERSTGTAAAPSSREEGSECRFPTAASPLRPGQPEPMTRVRRPAADAEP